MYFISQKDQVTSLYSYSNLDTLSDQEAVSAFKAAVEKANQKQVNTVDEFLKILPADLKKRYTLVYGSGSLQQASLKNPRAMVFSKDASVVYTFNGDPNQEGYHQIEIMYLDYKTGRVEMQEIRFSGEKNSPYKETVVENNPESCIGCHGTERSLNRAQNFKPIWDNYFVWPGVYGSVDDDVWRSDFGVQSSHSYVELNPSPNPLNLLLPENADHPEVPHFIDFFKNVKPNHIRYSQLDLNHPEKRGVRPNTFLTIKFTSIITTQLADILLSIKDIRESILDDHNYLFSLLYPESYSPMPVGMKTIVPDSINSRNAVQLLRIYYESLFKRQKQHLGISAPFGRAKAQIPSFDEYLNLANLECLVKLLKLKETHGVDLRMFSNDHYVKMPLYNTGANNPLLRNGLACINLTYAILNKLKAYKSEDEKKSSN